jgi:cell division protein FtsI (penicillin-binding protein 3)
MGILPFYNAIANGGKMVKLVSESEDGVVLQEQIAESQYVGLLQKGLEQCVSQGLMRKAGRDYVKVSACGRTFITEGNHRRMELFGYFPSDNPIYTIMVVMEKDGLPASAGGMCGPIFAHTVDVLVDLYNLQPQLARQFEDVDEVIEIVDTVGVANK